MRLRYQSKHAAEIVPTPPPPTPTPPPPPPSSSNLTQGIMWDGATGTTRDWWNKGLTLPWENRGGDWRNSAGVAQSTSSPYGSTTTNTGANVLHSFSGAGMVQLVNEWRADVNDGLLLRCSSGDGVQYKSRQHSDTTQRPILRVTANTGTFDCPCTADATLQFSDFQPQGLQDNFRVAFNTYNSVLQFNLNQLNSATTITAVELRLFTINQFTPAFTVQVMRVRAPTIWTGDNPSVQWGIAANVVLDANLSSQPGVLHHKVFDSTWDDNMVQYGLPQTQDLPPFDWTGYNAELGVDNSDGLDHKYARFVFNTGQTTAANGQLRFADAQPRGLGIAEPTELYARWYVMLENDWDTLDNVNANNAMKATGLHGVYVNDNLFDSGARSDGSNGWSARFHAGPKPSDANPYIDLRWMGNYVYHMDQSDGFGDAAYREDAVNRFRLGNFCAEKNRWYCIEQRVKMNTVPSEGQATADGILECWVNGVKVFSRTNMRWRNTSALKIQQWWCTWYHGGTVGVTSPMHCRQADFVIATSYIGPKRATPYAIPGLGEVAAINQGGSTAASVRPSTHSSNEWASATFTECYGGGVYIPSFSTHGAYCQSGSGGHNARENVDCLLFNYTTGQWQLLTNSNGIASRATPVQWTELTNTTYMEFGNVQVPAPAHVYCNQVYMPSALGGGSKGSILHTVNMAATQSGPPGGGGVQQKGCSHAFDLNTRAWSRVTNDLFTTLGSDYDSSSVFDAKTGRWYFSPGNSHSQTTMQYIDATDKAIRSISLPDKFGGNQHPDYSGGASYGMMTIDTDRHILLKYWSGGRNYLALDLDNTAEGWFVITPTGSGASSVPTSHKARWVYYPPDGRFYFRGNNSGNTLWRLTVPTGNWKTGTWTCDTVTLTGPTMANHTTSSGDGSHSHFCKFFYVDALSAMSWVPGETSPVYLMRPPA